MSLKRYTLPSMNTSHLCQQYLTLLFQKIHGHDVNARQHKHIAETYGEILPESVAKLLAEMRLSEQDVFFDLGSGLGKVVVQVFLTSVARESCGIEIIPELYQHSLQAAEQVSRDLPEFYVGERKLTFLLGSFLNIPLTQASVLLLGSPCFSQDILNPLGTLINRLENIRTVLTLRPINTLTRLAFKKALRIECSWDSALCYIYENRAGN